MKAYYDARAPEYDDWYLGTGRFVDRDRPGWDDAIDALVHAVAALRPKRTLDVACGTAFLTRHLRGKVTALDQSTAMLDVAADRLAYASLVQGDALDLPFDDGAFERVFAAHFYGHLDGDDRRRFVAEARRVAPELIVVDSALRDDTPAEGVEERMLNDGSRWSVLKRRFVPEDLANELGGGEVLYADRWFVMVRA